MLPGNHTTLPPSMHSLRSQFTIFLLSSQICNTCIPSLLSDDGLASYLTEKKEIRQKLPQALMVTAKHRPAPAPSVLCLHPRHHGCTARDPSQGLPAPLSPDPIPSHLCTITPATASSFPHISNSFFSTGLVPLAHQLTTL